MKFNHDIIVKENKWFWPAQDKACWPYLNERKDVPQRISSYVKNKNVMITAGANCGFYTKQFAELFNTVYAFEPDEINFNCLTLNLLDNLNVYKYQACLGNEHKTFSLEMSPGNCGGHNMGKNTHPGRIPMIKIDDLNLEECDLIQLDVEGYEIQVLEGALETIKRCKPVIVVEIAWSDATNMLVSLGYEKIIEIDGDWVFLPKL